jgi:hypothetical protein
MDLVQTGGRELDSFGSGQGPVVGSCELGSAPQSSTEDRENNGPAK